MKNLAITLLFIPTLIFAETKMLNELSTSLGIVIVNYAENEKSIEGENVSEAASGSISTINASISYKIPSGLRRAFSVTGSVPLLPSSEGSYLSLQGGYEFYFTDLGSELELYNSGTSLKVSPRLRYYAAAELGAGFLTYNTLSATKTDILFEMGGSGGLMYKVSKKINLKTSVGVYRGTGVVTSGFIIKAFVGGIFFL